MANANAINSPLLGTTGTGNFVGSNSPSLNAPNLGTPATGTLTNCTGLIPSSGLAASGTPNNTTFLRGDNSWVTISAGSGTVNSGTINQLAWYAATGTAVSGLATANNGLLVTSGAGVPSISTTLPNGLAMGTPASLTLTNATALPIAGITGLGTGVATALAVNVGTAGSFVVNGGVLGTPSLGTLTNCTGLVPSTGLAASGTPSSSTYLRGDNSWQTISSGTTPYTVITGTTQSMTTNNGYIANNAALITFTLPTTAAVGDVLGMIGINSGGWKIAQNASQSIQIGQTTSTVGTGGYVQSQAGTDSLELICVVANTKWAVLGAPQSAGLTMI